MRLSSSVSSFGTLWDTTTTWPCQCGEREPVDMDKDKDRSRGSLLLSVGKGDAGPSPIGRLVRLPVLQLRRGWERAAGEHHGLGVTGIPDVLRRPEHQQVGHIPLRLCRPASPAVSRALRRQPPPRTPAHHLRPMGAVSGCARRGGSAALVIPLPELFWLCSGTTLWTANTGHSALVALD